MSVKVLSNGRALVRLAEGAEVYFRGKIRVAEVICGSLQVLGSTIDSNTPPRDVYSPRGYSLLNIKASTSKQSSSSNASIKSLQEEVKRRMKTLGLEENDESVVEDGSCLFVLERLDSPWTQVLSHYLPHCHHKSGANVVSLFDTDPTNNNSPFLQAEKVLDINLFSDSSDYHKSRLYKDNPQWETAVQSVKFALNDLRQPRVLLAGGKGVGKSTCLRYLANRILEEVGPLVIIDLDPGQAEFTVPGCLSAVKVEEPILGPNFTSLRRHKTICQYLGEVNVSNVSRRFSYQMSRLIKKALKHPELNKLPWIVNTMGFNRGLGIKLIGQVISAVSPTTILEIRSRFPGKNYEVNFNSMSDKCNVLQFDAVPESLDAKNMGANDLWGIPEPAKLRDIVVLSYFGHLYRGPASTTFLQSVKPYKVSWSEVWVQVLHPDTTPTVKEVPAILNLSLVALGKVDEEEEKNEAKVNDRSLSKSGSDSNLISDQASVNVIGFGFVRGVDIPQKLFYVVTPLGIEDLAQVNCLSVGNIHLPKGIIVNQKTAKKSLPYRSRVSSTPLAQPWQRYSKPKGFDSKK